MGFIRQLFHRFGSTSAIVLFAPSLAIGSTILIDPAGDALSGPDIVSVSAGYDSTSLHLRLAFVPGTLDPANFGLSIGLDTDLNSDTPVTEFTPDFAGADYTLNLNLWPDPNPIFFNGKVQLGFYDSSFLGIPLYSIYATSISPDLSVPDQVGLIVPLDLLGSNGVMRFGATASKGVEEECFYSFTVVPCTRFYISDYATGVQGLDNITTNIPEPSSISLLLFGMMILLLRKITA